MRPIDIYFLEKDEPVKGCLDFLRRYLLQQDEHITETWKYGMPFYCYKGKMCCYLWVHKKHHQPYIGIVEGKQINHPALLAEQRARMKILLIDPNQNIPIATLNEVMIAMLALYK